MSKLRNDISFIFNSNDKEKYAQFEKHLSNHISLSQVKIVRITDALSTAEGLNRGANLAKGQFLIFCHDDILVLNSDILKIIDDTFRICDVFGACGTTRLVSGNWYDAGKPYTFGHVIAKDLRNPGHLRFKSLVGPVKSLVMGGQALDGIFIGCHRRIFEAIQGFDQITYADFVGYDVDFSFRAALAGAKVGINCDLIFFHDSHVGDFSTEKLRKWEEAQIDF